MRCVLLLLAIAACCNAHAQRADDNDITKRQMEDIDRLLRRVIGGQKVKEGMWPWLVALTGSIPTRSFFKFDYAYVNHFCGASLIARRWILTAAHCFPPKTSYNGKGLWPKYWKARFGDIDRESSLWDDVKGFIGDIFNKDDWKDWVITADRIVIHPGYNPDRSWLNDIALIRLSEEVPVEPGHVADIQKVTLAPFTNYKFPSDGQVCIFKGWGCKRGGGRVADVAFQVSLPKWNDETCSRLYGIHGNTRLCAGSRLQGKGICPGDSGGPLVCQKDNKWYQVGIASFTSANAPENYPGVFTRVGPYVNWVKQVIGNEF